MICLNERVIDLLNDRFEMKYKLRFDFCVELDNLQRVMIYSLLKRMKPVRSITSLNLIFQGHRVKNSQNQKKLNNIQTLIK